MDPFNRNPNSNVVHTHHHYHHHHHHHHRRNSDEDEQQYPPPPPPPRQQLNYGYPPAPNPTPPVADYSTVHHISHESHLPRFSNPSDSVVHVSHQHHHGPNPSDPPLSNVNKRTFRVITKADPNYALTLRHGEVVLARSDPYDQYQQWYKDEEFSTKVKDSEGYPAFSLVNKDTGEAIKHSIGASHPVRLIRYNPDYLDESILWTEGMDLGDGYRAIRMVNNVKLNLDAFRGDKLSGGVHDGTTIGLWEWNNGDHQQWKILPY